MPTALSHEARTIRALDWLFSRITNANGFLTKEVTTHHYSGDNRRFSTTAAGLQQDRDRAYKRSNCLMTIKMGLGERDPKVSGSGRQREQTQIVLICEQMLTKDQENEGLNLSDVMSHLRQDIRDAIFNDPSLRTSWAAVKAADTTLADLDEPSVVHLMMDGWDMPSYESQDGRQIIFLAYWYDDRQEERTLT